MLWIYANNLPLYITLCTFSGANRRDAWNSRNTAAVRLIATPVSIRRGEDREEWRTSRAVVIADHARVVVDLLARAFVEHDEVVSAELHGDP